MERRTNKPQNEDRGRKKEKENISVRVGERKKYKVRTREKVGERGDRDRRSETEGQ